MNNNEEIKAGMNTPEAETTTQAEEKTATGAQIILDGTIDEYEEDVVTVPRDEYDALVMKETLLETLALLLTTDDDFYNMRAAAMRILDIVREEEE